MNESSELEQAGRRDFLKSAGKFAAVTPPAITLLMSTSLAGQAHAKSGGYCKPRRKRRHHH